MLPPVEVEMIILVLPSAGESWVLPLVGFPETMENGFSSSWGLFLLLLHRSAALEVVSEGMKTFLTKSVIFFVGVIFTTE